MQRREASGVNYSYAFFRPDLQGSPWNGLLGAPFLAPVDLSWFEGLRTMKKFISILTITTLGAAIAACGHNTTERAATGAIAGGVVAGPVGAAVGAGTGAVVSKAAGDK